MIGVDVVDIQRLRETLDRSPDLNSKLFTDVERAYCEEHLDPVPHLAGTLAAKEAVMKAMGLGSLGAWAKRIEIIREPSGRPLARVDESEAIAISISHDGGVAMAAAVLQGRADEVAPVSR